MVGGEEIRMSHLKFICLKLVYMLTCLFNSKWFFNYKYKTKEGHDIFYCESGCAFIFKVNDVYKTEKNDKKDCLQGMIKANIHRLDAKYWMCWTRSDKNNV